MLNEFDIYLIGLFLVYRIVKCYHGWLSEYVDMEIDDPTGFVDNTTFYNYI